MFDNSYMQLQTTALVYASEKGHAEVVRELTRAGANVDHENNVCARSGNE